MPPKRKHKTKTKPPRKKPKPLPPIILPISTPHRESCEITYLDYKQGKGLGGGMHGSVYELCDADKKCPYVVKVLFGVKPDKFVREVENQKKAYKVAPKIYDAWTCLSREGALIGFIVMDKMDGTLAHYVHNNYPLARDFVEKLMKTLWSHVEQLHDMNIAHNDLSNFQNIFYKGNKWYLGDFGESLPLDESFSHDRYDQDDGDQLDELQQKLFGMVDD